MKIVEPGVVIITKVDHDDILKRIEDSGRICYKSDSKGNPGAFVRNLISRGHTSVLEHISITFDIICDRGVSHELVRHRIASYSQESTRYVNYGKKDIEFVKPIDLKVFDKSYDVWETSCIEAERSYKTMLENGCSPQIARSVLNNSLKTKIRMTMNLRSLINFFTLRCASSAHPDMRLIAICMLLWFKERIPEVFDSIPYDKKFVIEKCLYDDYASYVEEGYDELD